MSTLLDNTETIKQQARLFDDVRPPGAKLYLLKHGIQTSAFEIVFEIESGWFCTFSKEFRDEMKCAIATLDDLSDLIAQSSFVAYGTGAAGDEIDVFSFDKKDATRPNATSPSWKIHTVRSAEARFNIPFDLSL